MVDKLPADWALEKALALSKISSSLDYVKEKAAYYSTTIAFARYIQELEEPPVSKELLAARKGVASVFQSPHNKDIALGGGYDNGSAVRAALAAIEEYKEMVK